MEGKFTLYLKKNGEVIDSREFPNLITNDGRQILYDYLTDQSRDFIEYFATGLSGQTPSVTDTSLVHEIFRRVIESEESNSTTGKIIYHCAFLPEESAGTIEEIGLLSREKERPDLLLANFDLTVENWDVGTNNTALFKEGTNCLTIPATVSATTTTRYLREIDLSVLDNSDKIQIWINPSTTTNLTSIELRIEDDTSNYFKTANLVTGIAANSWNLKSTKKSDFTTTGSPNWANISSISVVCVVGTGGPFNISVDSLRAITTTSESKLFARKTISPPLVKSDNEELVAIYELTIGEGDKIGSAVVEIS